MKIFKHKIEFARLIFNPKYVYLRTRYMVKQFLWNHGQISEKVNIEFSLQDRGRWQYQLRILTRKINDSEYGNIKYDVNFSSKKYRR